MLIMRPAVRRQRVRLGAAILLTAAIVLGAALAVPGACRSATAAKPAPVLVKELPISGGLPIMPKPDTLARQPAAGALLANEPGSPITLDAGMRFSMAGVVCDTPEDAGQVVLRLRTSNDGLSWSRWHEAALGRSAHAGQSFTEPLWTGAARYLQVSARAASARAPVALANGRVVVIDSDPQASTSVAVEAAARQAAAPKVAEGSAAHPAQPTIVTRQQWGADESLRSGAPTYATVKMAFVHHTASGNDYRQADVPAIVRGIYAYHTQGLGWNDIGYDLLVDRFGIIYEGRYGGITRGVVGAQVLGFNTGSTGVAVIGTYTSAPPPTAAVTALENLLAWKLSLSGVDPLAAVTMTCGSTEKFKAGTTVSLPVIAGHRDANYTECPGDALYALLPTIRTTVARLIEPTPWIVTLRLSSAAVPANKAVTYCGSVARSEGAPGSGAVTIQRRPASGGAWAAWREAPLDAGGAYSLVVKMMNSNTWQFRARMPAATGTLTGYSSSQALVVQRADLPKWRVTLGLSTTSVPAGSLVSISGAVKTASGRPGSGAVTIQRRPASGGSWHTWRTAALGARGVYALTVRIVNRNTWQLRSLMAGTAANLAGYSPSRGLRIL